MLTRASPLSMRTSISISASERTLLSGRSFPPAISTPASPRASAQAVISGTHSFKRALIGSPDSVPKCAPGRYRYLYIYVAAARGKRRYVAGGQTGGDGRPPAYAAIIGVEAAVERSGVDAALGDQHGVRVNHERIARFREAAPLPHRVQPQHASAVRAGEPIVADTAERGDPVVLQPRIGSGVGSFDHAVFENRQTAERAGENRPPLGCDGVHVVVDQSVKRVQTAGSGPLLLSSLGNFLIPTMIGTDDMAFPTLN